MKPSFSLSITGVCIATLLASCATRPPRIIKAPVVTAGNSSLSRKLFQEVNTYRGSHGSPDIQRNATLDRLAQEHCEYLRRNRGTFSVHGKNVSHFGSETRSSIAIGNLQMLDYGENVASTTSYGSDARTARALVILWQQSHGHEPVMRNPAWTDTGIGAVVDADGTVFATQVFGEYNNFPMIARQSSPQF